MAQDQILIFDLRASNQILFCIKSDEEEVSQEKRAQTFSGFNWCLNRENLLATYSKTNSNVRFWDLPIDSTEGQAEKIEQSEKGNGMNTHSSQGNIKDIGSEDRSDHSQNGLTKQQYNL